MDAGDGIRRKVNGQVACWVNLQRRQEPFASMQLRSIRWGQFDAGNLPYERDRESKQAAEKDPPANADCPELCRRVRSIARVNVLPMYASARRFSRPSPLDLFEQPVV